jgi:hypothetical protein
MHGKTSWVQNLGHFSCEPRDSSIVQVVVESVNTARIELCLHCNRQFAGTKQQITALVKNVYWSNDFFQMANVIGSLDGKTKGEINLLKTVFNL